MCNEELQFFKIKDQQAQTLHNVKYLFFYLFKFIFHLNNDILHFSLIALAAGSIYFTSHLLRYKAQLLPLSVPIIHSLPEICQMVCKTLFLFTDIQFFDIINKFLFHPVFIIINFRNTLETINNLSPYLLDT